MRNIITFLVLLSSLSLFANEDSLDYKPVQLSFVYPLSTHGLKASQSNFHFSMNALIGKTGSIYGAEFGGLANINLGRIEGAQFAGLANLNATSLTGAQFAGLINKVNGEVHGFQAAGLANHASGIAEGAQISGLLNKTKRLQGAQLSGVANMAYGDVQGTQLAGVVNKAENTNEILQAAGVVNLCDSVIGAQIAGVANISEVVDGAQISGLINIANEVKGLQLAGLINICDTIDGVPIAVLSVVKKGGYRAFELSTDENLWIHGSFRIGVEHFYSIFRLGYRVGEKYNASYGIGFGILMGISPKSAFDLEYTFSHIGESLNFKDDFQHQLGFHYSYTFNENLSLFVGPSFNVVGGHSQESSEHIAPSWAINYNQGKNIQAWVGLNLGVRF